MSVFNEIGRIFTWVKGDKTKETRSKWDETYYGAIDLTEDVIKAVEKPDALNHPMVNSLRLKPAFNSDRAWIYRFTPEGGSEITYAIRFKTADVANKFKSEFERVVQIKQDAEDARVAAQKVAEEEAAKAAAEEAAKAAEEKKEEEKVEEESKPTEENMQTDDNKEQEAKPSDNMSVEEEKPVQTETT